MPISTADLMGRVYDLFTSLYPSSGAGIPFLAFEKLGVPISPDMFRLHEDDTASSPALAVERLSEIANTAVQVVGDAVLRSAFHIDAMVELLVGQAMPSSADMAGSLGAARVAATPALSITSGSLVSDSPFARFHPVYASPVDWYDPGAIANWTSHTVGDSHGTAAPSMVPPRQVSVSTPRWRVLPSAMQPALRIPIAPDHPVLAKSLLAALATDKPVQLSVNHPSPGVAFHAPIMQMHQQVVPMQAHMVTLAASPVHATLQAAPAATVPAPVEPAPAVKSMALVQMRPMVLALAADQLNATATAQPVSSDSVDMSFEHCIVTLSRRPWFPEAFLMTRNWYVPGYKSGSFSSGTGAGDTGLLPVLTSGFVVIRNLKISAKWSDQDLAAVQGSAAFGPFSLVGRTFDAATGALTCPGMQIIGWFCQALPVLPPAPDPTLAAATPSSTPPASAVPDPTANTGQPAANPTPGTSSGGTTS
jgi:hypothetical protein